MSIWVTIIALNLVLTVGIASLSSNHKILNQTKYKISNVLGIQKIAQTDDTTTPPPTDTPPDTSFPSDTSPSPDIQSPPPSLGTDVANPQSSQLPTTQSTPLDQITPDNFPLEKLTPNDQIPNQTSQPQEQMNTSLNPSETKVIQTEAILNPTDLINSPENINDQSVDEAKKEDEQLAKIQDPTDQTRLLINFVADKVRDMDNFIKTDDFSSTNFAAQRFNDEVNQAINNLDKLPFQTKVQLQRKLINFCKQADQTLRTIGLVVPEELEQDFEMARGQCQEIQP